MEADWEIELGGDSPVIDARWSGFVDLRQDPPKTRAIPETAQLAALAVTLASLNSSSSQVWTSKCDVWWVESFDPYEMDAAGDSPLWAIACYIDVLPANEDEWLTPETTLEWCKRLCGRLRSRPLRCCRADLVLRAASLTSETEGFGVTAYVTACGVTRQDAASSLETALAWFAEAVLTFGRPAGYAS